MQGWLHRRGRDLRNGELNLVTFKGWCLSRLQGSAAESYECIRCHLKTIFLSQTTEYNLQMYNSRSHSAIRGLTSCFRSCNRVCMTLTSYTGAIICCSGNTRAAWYLLVQQFEGLSLIEIAVVPLYPFRQMYPRNSSVSIQHRLRSLPWVRYETQKTSDSNKVNCNGSKTWPLKHS